MQQIQKMVIRNGIDSFMIEEENEIKRFLLSVFSLPLLPHERIEPAFQQLVENLSENSSNISQSFILGFNTIWINYVKARNFSIHGNLDLVTDAFETYGNQLHAKIGTFPSAWKFTGNLYKILF